LEVADDPAGAFAITVEQYKFVGTTTHHNCEGAGRSDRARANDSDLHILPLITTASPLSRVELSREL
jgi:hypothetical protein